MLEGEPRYVNRYPLLHQLTQDRQDLAVMKVSKKPGERPILKSLDEVRGIPTELHPQAQADPFRR